MKKSKQDYSLWRRLCGPCEDKDAADESYRMISWVRVLVSYPFIIFPAWASVDVFLSISRYPELSLVFIDIWVAGHALLVIASLLAFGGSLNLTGERGNQLMRHATLACCILEAFVSLMVGFIVGINHYSPHFLLFLTIVAYRTIFPFRYGFSIVVVTNIALVSIGSWMFTLPGILEMMFETTVGVEIRKVEFFAGQLLFPIAIFMLFWAVNYLVNQRNIMESYLTNIVLARYLPAELVAEAASIPFWDRRLISLRV
ncbi:MAG: hypothetical protein VYA34_00515 [Myxococcota bacterium]|nr:hypothetical protein [Myxococcota bacterium]